MAINTAGTLHSIKALASLGTTDSVTELKNRMKAITELVDEALTAKRTRGRADYHKDVELNRLKHSLANSRRYIRLNFSLRALPRKRRLIKQHCGLIRQYEKDIAAYVRDRKP